MENALDAVTTAHAAAGPWAQTAPRTRAEVLRRAFEIMSSELEDCARLIVLENGKSWGDAMGEAAYAAEFFRWFSEEACRVPGDFRLSPSGDKTIVVDHRPLGVAYMITPWNFPAAMATRKLARALAAGGTAVLKPAVETPLTALWVEQVLMRAGAPKGVVTVITTSEPGPVSEAVLSDHRVGTLSFTGSTPIGKLLLAQTARRALPSSMELGGNAPLLVLEGEDVERSVIGDMAAKMRNGGSACTGLEVAACHLVEPARAAARSKGTYLRERYVHIRRRRGDAKAVVAVGHEILLAAYRILETGVPYIDPGPPTFTARTAERERRRAVENLRRLDFEVALTPTAA